MPLVLHLQLLLGRASVWQIDVAEELPLEREDLCDGAGLCFSSHQDSSGLVVSLVCECLSAVVTAGVPAFEGTNSICSKGLSNRDWLGCWLDGAVL